jgi:hypothetical protein
LIDVEIPWKSPLITMFVAYINPKKNWLVVWNMNFILPKSWDDDPI